jgi:hypothetical protein
MAVQIQHVEAITLLKTWYPTASSFNPKKAAAKLRTLPEKLASDPEAEQPSDKDAKKTLEIVTAAADAGEDIEVINGESNGNGHAEKPAKAKGKKAAKVEVKEKGSKPAKAKKKTAKEPGVPSNKEIVYKAWKESKQKLETAELSKKVKGAVKDNTIRGWLSAWKKKTNLPACANK